MELTPDGLALVDDAVVAKTESDRQLLGRLDPADVDALQALVKKLLLVLEPPGG